jgi:hypothetical protein
MHSGAAATGCARKGIVMIDIGRVFSTSIAMLRQRFWLLLGMLVVFFAIQMAASTVLTVGLLVIGMAGAMSIGAGLGDPTALGGLGAGFVLFFALFYAAYVVLVLAQQAAMVTLASPLEEPAFGTAMMRGFRSALPFFAISVLLLLGYGVLMIALIAVIGVTAAGGGAAGGLIGGVLGLLSLPLMIFLACRFSVLVPVVAVDQVFNPIRALRRSWSVTRGKALRILLALLSFGAAALVLLGVPFAIIFGGVFAGQDSPALGITALVIGSLLFIPLGAVFAMFTAAFTAALHCEVTGGGAEQLEAVFA